MLRGMQKNVMNIKYFTRKLIQVFRNSGRHSVENPARATCLGP